MIDIGATYALRLRKRSKGSKPEVQTETRSTGHVQATRLCCKLHLVLRFPAIDWEARSCVGGPVEGEQV